VYTFYSRHRSAFVASSIDSASIAIQIKKVFVRSFVLEEPIRELIYIYIKPLAMQALTGARAALTGARAAIRRSAQVTVPRRRFAAEPEIPFADYRTGKVTLTEWVDANRHKVAGSFFAFYVVLIGYKLRPKKKAAEPAADPSEATA